MNIHIIYNLILFFGVINLFRMAIFLIGSDIYRVKQHFTRKSRRRPLRLPTITVAVPAHNEAGTVIRAVRSIIDNGYPRTKLQILVADNASTDATPDKVRSFIKDYPNYPVKLISARKRGKAHALNCALKKYATGELVMCLDADSYLEPGALRNAVAYFLEDPQIAALASNVHIISRPGLLNLIQCFEYLVCYQMKRAQTVFQVEYIIGGIGSMFRHSILKKSGYYDTDTVTEDIDITMKLLRAGNKVNKVVYGADVVAHTESVLTVSGLIRQRFRWKYGRSQTFMKNLDLFFKDDPRFTKALTYFYLPLAIFFDIAFFFEPFMIAYILYIVVTYADPITLLSALVVITFYLSLNILAENTFSAREKLKFLVLAPTMYLYFYLLSFVEYWALIETIFKARTIPASIGVQSKGWLHPTRATAQQVRDL